MSADNNQAPYWPPPLGPSSVYLEAPPGTISGEELAKMVPPMPTIDWDAPCELTPSDDESIEGPSPKKSRARTTKKPSTKVQASQKSPRKPDSTRGRTQKQDAASTQAKKEAKQKGTKKGGA
ncbi:hypothetical protein DICSQDRAFT_125324 [Dichomitus squalens LYAD-421 SS1]|uniref:uncharacterized protein n=1 Tax=Dichomitus squalens (strain LYAD-421) TaxID=732165 RepID=UPI0004413358|nr:uncharacterized protein DICSQDRAFT_125324 [Dichomitus squalens LYAD-421 SS1]EJF64337.1 hypothetical protein DICSQDRAFT_125324 [Dichomitus squalens LYAD-421 SS1]